MAFSLGIIDVLGATLPATKAQRGCNKLGEGPFRSSKIWHGHRFEALLSTRARGLPQGAAIGHAKAADERAQVAEGRNEGDYREADGKELESKQGAAAGAAGKGLRAKA